MVLVEFQVIALLGLLPLTFGLLEVALLFAGAAQLDYVAFDAAREAAMSQGDAGAARRAAARAMVPQLARFDPGITPAGAGDVVANAFVAAQAESAAFLALDTDRPEAGLLRLRATYCHPLHMPMVPALLLPVLRRIDLHPFHQRCYAAGRVPVVADAVLPLPPLPGAPQP